MSLDTPQNGDAESLIGYPDVGENTASGRKSRTPLVVSAVVAVVLIVGAAAFGLRALLGTGLESMQAIPGDVDVVVSVDFLQLRDSERVEALIQTFAQPMEEAGYIDSSDIDLFADLNEALEEEVGWNLDDDVIPWLGRSISAGFWIPADIEATDAFDGIVSIAVRDAGAAETFLDENADPSVAKSEFEGGLLYEATDGDDLFVWLGGEHLLVAPSRTTVRQGIEAVSGQSILEDESFSRLVDELPSERLAMFYAGSGVFDAVATAGADFVPPDQLGIVEGYQGIAFSLNLEDTGVRFDAVQLLEGEAAAQAAAANEVASVSSLPADTIGYVGFDIPEGAIADLLDEFRTNDPEFYDEISADAESELGVDLFGEVLPSIAGESLFAAMNSRDGALAQETGIPLGILVSLGLADPAPMQEAVTSLENLAAGEGVIIERGNPNVLFADGLEIVAYDVTGDALVVGSAESVLSGFMAGSGGLTDTALYRDLDASLPGDGLMFYLDLGRTFDLFDLDPSDRMIVDPLRGTGASSSFDGEILTGSLMILIDYAEPADGE